MTDCNTLPTLAEIEASKLAMEDIDSFTYDETETFVDAKDVTRKTINGLVSDIDEVVTQGEIAIAATNETTVRTLQLFDKNNEENVSGFFVSWTTGVLSANLTYFSSGYIDTDELLDYSFSSLYSFAFYDASKVFISGDGPSAGAGVYASPTNAKFIRLSVIDDADIINSLMFSQSSSVETLDKFGFNINPNATIGLDRNSLAVSGVDGYNTSFLNAGKNLIDPLNLEAAFSGSLGNVTPSSVYFLTDFIPVKNGATYIISEGGGVAQMRFVTAFDKYYNVIPSEGDDNSSVTLTPSDEVKYYRISFVQVDVDTMQLSEGTTVTPFNPFVYDLDTTIIVRGENVEYLTQTKNLFNDGSLIAGFSGSNGVINPSGTLSLSDYIVVKPNKTYIVSELGVATTMRFVAAYDRDKNIVPSEGFDVTTASLTVPDSGVAFYRITVENTDLVGFQFEEGGTITDFVDYGFVMDEKVLVTNAQDKAFIFYNNKKWTAYGDSITAQESWQPYTVARLGLLLTNLGVGSTEISGSGSNAMNHDDRVNTIPVDTDVLTILGGTNDWAQDAVLGSIDSVDIQEFNGALNVMLTKIYTRVPTAQVVLMTTTYGELYNFAVRGWTNAFTNNVGLTTGDYAEACRAMAKKWGIPLADTYSDSGWNTVNIRDYINDDGGLLHPNDAGGQRMSASVTGKLFALVV